MSEKGLSIKEGSLPSPLVFDESFIPCPAEEGDEMYDVGIFAFNISRMIEFIQENPSLFPVYDINPNDYSDFPSASLDEAYLETITSFPPVILAEIAPGRFSVIDGNHRIEKALQLGMTTLQAYRISPVHHTRFLVYKKSYIAYVEYWNGKLSE